MPKTYLKKSGGWTEMKSIFLKKTTGWAEIRKVFLKKASGWVLVFQKLALPDTTTSPSIRTTNTGSGTIYDGPVATSPQYLNEDLFGKDGTYTNYTSIFGRKFTYADTASATSRATVVNDDRFTSAGGVTNSDRLAVDGKYLFYELTVQNGSATYEINPVSSPIYMIKQAPYSNSFTTTGAVQSGEVLIANIDIEYYYYNRPELSTSYVEWYVGDWAGDTSGTPAQRTSLQDALDSTSSSQYIGSDYFYVSPSYLGKYITLLLIGESSWTRYNGWSTSTYSMDYAYAGGGNPVSGPITFSNIAVKDYLGRNGLDNRGRWPTGTLNQYTGTVNGYESGSTLRIRYRMWNANTGLYWNPYTLTQTTASGAWASWNSDGSGLGYISNVSVSGTTATFYDYFSLDETVFDGGGSPTWYVEIELSALKPGGTRTYYLSPYDTYAISKRIDPTISASPTTVTTNTDVTFSGSFAGYPATPSTNAYPRQYKISYGDGNNSGWLPVGEYANGTLNPTYSITKQYTSTGTYTASIETIPYGTTSSTTVTVANLKTAPTISSASAAGNGGAVTVNFTGGSGPYYQLWWQSTSTAPTTAVSPDATSTSSPLVDSTGPNLGTYYAFVRSTQTAGETSVGPSTLASAWSAGYAFTASITRTLSYNANGGSGAPSSSSGSDSGSGWSTTVSYTAPTRSGYTFNGWNTNSSGTGTNYSAGNSITLTADVTLYAKWTANNLTAPTSVSVSGSAGNHSVTFSGGSGPYYQVYWTTTSSTSATGYDANGSSSPISVTNLSNPSSGTTYYFFVRSVSALTNTGSGPSTTISSWSSPASWTAPIIQYTVTWNANGGSVSPTSSTGNSGSTVTAPTPTRSGYSFNGWYTAASGGSFVVSGGGTYYFSGTLTLYAQWTSTFVTPTSTAPALQFQRLTGSSYLRWYCDYTTSLSGSYSYIIGMNWQLSTTASTAGLLNSGTRAYPGAGTYPYNAGGTVWAFKAGVDGQVSDITYSSSARYGRARVALMGTDGNTYYGTWSSWI